LAGGEAGAKATIAALFANAGIAVAKFVAFVFTGSASMLAEGIHSVADTSNQALLLLGIRRAKRPATAIHPFGYGRERYFWSFIVAMVLFTLGGLFSMFEGYEKLRHPHEIESVGWAFGVLGVAIVLETLSFRTAIKEANHVRGDASWWSFIRHSRSPELPVVLLEDLGALLGLVFALGGVTLAAVTDEPRFDALGSLAIGILLCVIAYVLATELRSLLIGESASTKDLEAIDRALRDPNVQDVAHVRTQHIGPNELLVGAKVRMRPGLDIAQVAETIDRIEDRVRRDVQATSRIYIEPDIHRASPSGDTTA
jgi:cation diffusion facilitator family transporter